MHSVTPKGVAAPVGGYCHGAETGPNSRHLFISGQIPERPDGTVASDFDSQCAQVWENIGHVLKAAGLGYGNLVKVTTFLTDRSQAAANGAIRRRFLGDHKPALTVIVAQTLEPQWLLEIEAVAAT